MRSKFITILVVFAVLWLSGCAPKNIVVLVPDPDGSVGKITVANRAGSVEIDTPNQATEVRDEQTVPRAPYQIKKRKNQCYIRGSSCNSTRSACPFHFVF